MEQLINSHLLKFNSMLEEGKTAVTIVQELIAVLTTRKEACEKILKKNPGPEITKTLNTCATQSDGFINELMSELNQFGDAVMGEVDRDNAYQNRWREVLKKEDPMNAQELFKTFQTMEESLAQLYGQFAAEGAELPASLQELLQKQAQQVPDSF
jgi:DNA-binding FrmR family transcriptional regulator